MMVTHDISGARKAGNWLEDISAYGGVGAHLHPFFIVEFSGLVQDGVGNANLAHIVHWAGIKNGVNKPTPVQNRT
jgi:hypothetical protein